MSSRCFDTQQIKAEALRLGFSAFGVARAEAVNPDTAQSFHQWITQGHQANMGYMGNHTEKRLDPRLLMEGTQSIISLALNYYPQQHLSPDQYQFAWYAYGKDYHDVMKAKLKALETFITSQLPFPIQTRIFCDTAPVLERYWAWKAGLGWIGKNTQLIIPKAGSTFFLGEIFIDCQASAYNTPLPSRCGTCTNCLSSCPTQALEAPFKLNSARCLSYLTIEHREAIPTAEALKMSNKIYGCDECQRACPWNRFAMPCTAPELHPIPALLNMKKEDWHTLTEEQYRTLFKGSAVKRTKYAGLMRNIEAAKSYNLEETEKDASQ